MNPGREEGVVHGGRREERVLHLVRHGATAWNEAGRYQGWAPVGLSGTGRRQARRLASWAALHAARAHLLSSDLPRALETARAIQAATGSALRLDAGLRELHMGRWQGLTYDEIQADWPQRVRRWYDDPDATVPPGGERLESLRRRVMGVLLRAMGETEDPLLLVTHAGPVRVLLARLTQAEELWTLDVPTASVTSLGLALRPPATGCGVDAGPQQNLFRLLWRRGPRQMS